MIGRPCDDTRRITVERGRPGGRSHRSDRNGRPPAQEIIDTIPVLAWYKLPDGSNEFLNQRWQDYTGVSQQEGCGWGWKVTFHPDDIEPLMERWRALLSSGEAGEIEARLRRYDGVYRWFLIRVEPLRDELGNIVRWYGTSTDIDDLKRAQSSCSKVKKSSVG